MADAAQVSMIAGDPVSPCGCLVGLRDELRGCDSSSRDLGPLGSRAAADPYALIGGVAVGIHSGSPRATLDVDFAATTAFERRAVVDTLERAGLSKRGEFPHSVNFQHRTGEPVQISFDPSFDPMIARAERFDVGGLSVAIVRKADLIAMKERAAGDPTRRKSKRLRDQADVALLRGDVPDPDEGW